MLRRQNSSLTVSSRIGALEKVTNNIRNSILLNNIDSQKLLIIHEKLKRKKPNVKISI